ncbi:MAG: RagB/SusD family nutrient uptake outer membrane protein [Bacteroidales bacterium]
MKKIFAFIPAAILGLSSCGHLDIEPVGQVIPEKVSDYRAVLTNGYKTVPVHKQLLNVRADELNMNDDWGFGSNNMYRDIARWNDQTPDPNTREYQWTDFYKTIFTANVVITDGPAAKQDGSEDLNQLLGEAYLLRAYMHFELVNMYAKPYDAATSASDRGIPLSLKIDIEQVYKPVPVADVYAQIESDLETGLGLLSVDNYKAGLNYRFSLDAAYALKARVALYKKDYATALNAAKEVISRRKLSDMNTEDLIPTNFESTESIMALERVVNADIATDFAINNVVMDLYDMENDLRPAKFFSYGALQKCRNQEEQVTFRTAEAYLIAAESAAHLGNSAEAAGYLSTLADHRLKAEGASAKKAALQAMSSDELVAEVAKERLRELVGEGHRWFDLRRTTQEELNKTVADVPVTLPKGDPRYTIRIPKSAIEANPELMN